MGRRHRTSSDAPAGWRAGESRHLSTSASTGRLRTVGVSPTMGLRSLLSDFEAVSVVEILTLIVPGCRCTTRRSPARHDLNTHGRQPTHVRPAKHPRLVRPDAGSHWYATANATSAACSPRPLSWRPTCSPIVIRLPGGRRLGGASPCRQSALPRRAGILVREYGWRSSCRRSTPSCPFWPNAAQRLHASGVDVSVPDSTIVDAANDKRLTPKLLADFDLPCPAEMSPASCGIRHS